jgi:hypothetical protein
MWPGRLVTEILSQEGTHIKIGVKPKAYTDLVANGDALG